MRDHIKQVIKQLEFDYDVKVLYACEAGSRAWGFPSKESDYDVRFIYIHRTDWYLSIDEKRDVIEIPKEDSISMPIDERLDMSGWELKKALKLFRKSNPSLLEWLHSSIIYDQSYSPVDRMRKLEQIVFSPIACVNHYLKMGSGNYCDCLQREDVKIKNYINVLRPIFAAKWVVVHQTAPPIDFQILLDGIVSPGDIKNEISHLINTKMKGEEWSEKLNIEIIHLFIQKEIQHLEEYAKKMPGGTVDCTAELNLLFRDTLREVWN